MPIQILKFIFIAWIGSATTCFASASGTTYNSDVTIGDLGNLYMYIVGIDTLRSVFPRPNRFSQHIHIAERHKGGGRKKQGEAIKINGHWLWLRPTVQYNN